MGLKGHKVEEAQISSNRAGAQQDTTCQKNSAEYDLAAGLSTKKFVKGYFRTWSGSSSACT